MMLITFSFVGALSAAGVDPFAVVHGQQQGAMGGTMSAERAKQELKQYRKLRSSLGLRAPRPAWLRRTGAYAGPLLAVLAVGAGVGGLAYALPDDPVGAFYQASQASHDMYDKSNGGSDLEAQLRYEPKYDEDDKYVGYQDLLTGEFFDGEPMPKLNEPLKRPTIQSQPIPGIKYAYVGAGALGGYGLYRLAAWLHNRRMQKRAHARTQAMLARWPQYEKQLPDEVKGMVKRLHDELATSGTMAVAPAQTAHINQVLTSSIMRREQALQAQIKKAGKTKKRGRA